MVNIVSSVVIAASLFVVTVGSVAADDARATCDRLAGSPLDPNRVTDGVPFDALDFAAAEAPCRQAVVENPTVPRLQFELARVLQAKGDTAPAMRSYETLVANGYPVAALALGRYLQNDGADQDYARAAVNFRKAVADGITAAATDLAVLTMNGLGVPLDYSESMRLLAGPVKAGDSHAQYLLGYLYENGLGGPADLGKAVDLYRLSAAQEDGAGEYSLGHLYDLGKRRSRQGTVITPRSKLVAA